jgi:uncharacterized GH25 family protein
MQRLSAMALVWLLFVSEVPAHDYWLQPETHFPKPGVPVAVHLLVGDDFVSELERPFQKPPTLRFQLVSQDKAIDLAAAAQDGQKPLAQLTLVQPGSYWLVLDRDLAYITLEAKKFNAYLEEEGLQDILAERKKAHELDQAGRERYRRYLKALLHVGAATEAWRKTFAQQLEIVPLANPTALKLGDTLTVKVLFEGKPLPAAPLFAYGKAANGTKKQSLKTGKDGTAAVRLDTAGPYLVRLVHMRRCAGDPKADWESFWAAWTFGIK